MSEIRSFSTKGKILLLLNIAVLIAIMLVAAIFYSILPESVPTHYDFAGNPTSYGDKFTLIATVFLASIAAPSIIILLSLLRFRLIEKYRSGLALTFIPSLLFSWEGLRGERMKPPHPSGILHSSHSEHFICLYPFGLNFSPHIGHRHQRM